MILIAMMNGQSTTVPRKYTNTSCVTSAKSPLNVLIYGALIPLPAILYNHRDSQISV